MRARPLTQGERVNLVNAVQQLVGRIDRVIPGDALFAAYQLVAERLRAEFAARYAPGSETRPEAPVTTYRCLPGPEPPPRGPEDFDPFG